MEPVTPSVIALKLAPSAIQLISSRVVGRLAPDEEKRLRKALAEVLVEAASTPPPKLRKEPFAFLSWRGDRKRVEKAFSEEVGGAGVISHAQGQEGEAPVAAAQRSWRDALAAHFAAAAEEGMKAGAEDEGSWKAVVGGITPNEWGERMQGGLEWRMATDSRLRYVLQRLDWGTEQSSREADAYATSVYLAVIPIALGLGFAILLALVAIVVVLAVN